MDPNETLSRIRVLTAEVLDDEDTENTAAAGFALAEYVESLDIWLSDGGFRPEAWRRHGSLGT